MSDLTPGQPPALRASDADREQTIETLRRAAGEGRLDVDELDERIERAYGLRTIAELHALTADVTVPGGPSVGAATGGGPLVRPGPGGTRVVVSIMGGHDRRGRWRVARSCVVLNVMGGSDLDMTAAELSDERTTITVLSVMGGGSLRVPEGTDVRVVKLGIMGGNDVRLDERPPAPGAPVIRVRLLSNMGGFRVRQGPKNKRRRDRERRRAAEQREPAPRIDPPTAALMEGAPPGGTDDRSMPTEPHSDASPGDAPGESQVGNLPG